MMDRAERKFVGRAGGKLQAAFDAFRLDVTGWVCADFGCNVGGFTDCLLQNGAAKVYAIDTGYGQLAWRLRNDSRVIVMERTNALYCPVPEPVDLVAIDVGWTSLAMAARAALGWLRPGGRIIALLKPHYELARAHSRATSGPIDPARCRRARLDACDEIRRLGAEVLAAMASPIRGKGGNEEFLLLLSAGAYGGA